MYVLFTSFHFLQQKGISKSSIYYNFPPIVCQVLLYNRQTLYENETMLRHHIPGKILTQFCNASISNRYSLYINYILVYYNLISASSKRCFEQFSIYLMYMYVCVYAQWLRVLLIFWEYENFHASSGMGNVYWEYINIPKRLLLKSCQKHLHFTNSNLLTSTHFSMEL